MKRPLKIAWILILGLTVSACLEGGEPTVDPSVETTDWGGPKLPSE